MKVLICGSRSFYNWRLLEQTLYEFRKEENIDEIIQGCTGGADSLAKQYGIYEKIPVRDFPADWTKYGKVAGPIRNAQMLREGSPDLVLAFRKEGSKGTTSMINQAIAAGVPVKIVEVG